MLLSLPVRVHRQWLILGFVWRIAVGLVAHGGALPFRVSGPVSSGSHQDINWGHSGLVGILLPVLWCCCSQCGKTMSCTEPSIILALGLCHRYSSHMALRKSFFAPFFRYSAAIPGNDSSKIHNCDIVQIIPRTANVVNSEIRCNQVSRLSAHLYLSWKRNFASSFQNRYCCSSVHYFYADTAYGVQRFQSGIWFYSKPRKLSLKVCRQLTSFSTRVIKLEVLFGYYRLPSLEEMRSALFNTTCEKKRLVREHDTNT